MISQLVIWKYWLPLANGLWTTVYLSLLGIALGAAVGLAVCLAMRVEISFSHGKGLFFG
jgi:ABC-type amino acid transport system permease subunit